MAALRPGFRNGPWPISLSSPKWYPLPLPQSLTWGPTCHPFQRNLNEHDTIPERDHRGDLSEFSSNPAPSTKQRTYKTPLCSAHLPSQNPSKNHRQAALVRSRRATTTAREHRRYLVSLDPPLDLLLHLLLYLNLAHLPDTLFRPLVHQDIETALDQIPLSARRNSGERLQKLQDTSTAQNSPPDPPDQPERHGKNVGSEIHSCTSSSSVLCMA
jgi:hypothetical protein